jgi:HD-GYP domain-containing protein (c-di-GMP phosphodiesterase class II)
MNDKIKEYEDLVEDLSTQAAENFYQTIQILSTIANMQEKFYIGSHSNYVSQHSAQIAEMLGMSDTEVFEIKIAGLLHDIGKLGFKDALNMKFMSEMDDNELKQYTMHPELGKQLLEKHKSFDDIGEIIFQHHEKMDGSGFPRHMNKNQIHPGAAIIVVVDTYHNIFYKVKRDQTTSPNTSLKYTSAAAYMDSTKNKFSSALNYLHQKKGILFDKGIVEIFTEITEVERRNMGMKTVVRIPINRIEEGMIFAEDYYTSFGMLIAARGECIAGDMKKTLVKFAEHGEMPHKILVMK